MEMWFQVDVDHLYLFQCVKSRADFQSPKDAVAQHSQLTLSFYYTWPKDQGVEHTS